MDVLESKISGGRNISDTLRLDVEKIVFLVGGDPTHIIPAIIQGGLTIVCLSAFLFI